MLVGVSVGVLVGVLVGVSVGVLVGVLVGVSIGVAVLVGVGVFGGNTLVGSESLLLSEVGSSLIASSETGCKGAGNLPCRSHRSRRCLE